MSAKPFIDFMIIGAQKSGTTALAHFLSQHPKISMSRVKENHLFDSEAYDPAWTINDINCQYAETFDAESEDKIKGEATPIYLYWKEVIPELRKYNPSLKLIVLLRDPVERAISQYQMERARGNERLPFWLALFAESWRLRNDTNKRAATSSHRIHSYRNRGLYSKQLEVVFNQFSERQVLMLTNAELSERHSQTLKRVFDFLEVSIEPKIAQEKIFSSGNLHKVSTVTRLILRISYWPEFIRLRRLLPQFRNDNVPKHIIKWF